MQLVFERLVVSLSILGQPGGNVGVGVGGVMVGVGLGRVVVGGIVGGGVGFGMQKYLKRAVDTP